MMALFRRLRVRREIKARMARIDAIIRKIESAPMTRVSSGRLQMSSCAWLALNGLLNWIDGGDGMFPDERYFGAELRDQHGEGSLSPERQPGVPPGKTA